LLDWIISDLRKAGIKDFVVVTKAQDRNKVPTGRVVVQEQPTGMAGAVLAAKNIIKGPMVIVNGDDLIDPQILKSFIAKVKANPQKIVLTGIKRNLTGGYFSGLKIVEKPITPPSPSFKIVLDYFPKIEKFVAVLGDDYEMGINKLKPEILVKAEGYFCQLKYPWQMLDMTKLFLTKRRSVGIDKTAKLLSGAEAVNSYIGPKVILGQHVLVRDSIIEAGTVVGYHTEICRSYVGPNNNFHTNYVGDSVIEAESNLGSGARLANMRFDKKAVLAGRPKLGAVMAKGSQLGINACIMPGVTLGEKAIVASGLVVSRPVEAGEFKKS